MNIDGNQKCLIFAGQTLADKAEELCQSLEGDVPVPINEQENTDYFNAFHKLNKTVKYAMIGKHFFLLSNIFVGESLVLKIAPKVHSSIIEL